MENSRSGTTVPKLKLPNEEIFKFYEGSETTEFTDLNSVTLNKAPSQLLENEQYLLGELEKANDSISGPVNTALDEIKEDIKGITTRVETEEGATKRIDESISGLTKELSDLKGSIGGDNPETIIPQATTEKKGIIELATQLEVNTGTDKIRAVTPGALKITLKDVYKIDNATIGDITGNITRIDENIDEIEGNVTTVTNKVTNIENSLAGDNPEVIVPAATTEKKGIVELATNEEVKQGSSPALVVTVAGLKNNLNTDYKLTHETIDELRAEIDKKGDMEEGGHFDKPITGVPSDDPTKLPDDNYVTKGDVDEIIKQSATAIRLLQEYPDDPESISEGILYGIPHASEVEYITTPKITSPTTGQTGLSTELLIEGSPYKAMFSEDIRRHRQFQIAKDTIFSEGLRVQEVNSDYLTSPSLDKGTKYYLRIRDVSINDRKSGWSTVVNFTTTEGEVISTPAITLKGFNDSQTDIGSGLKVEGSKFTTDGSSTHSSTDWKVTQGDSDVWSSVADPSNLASITIPDGTLQKSTKYTITVQYHGSEADSAISKKEFTTAADFGNVVTPNLEIEGGDTETVKETPTFKGGEFKVTKGKDTHEMTDWIVQLVDGDSEVYKSESDTTNKVSITLPKEKLQTNKDYKVSCRYKGKLLGWSEWSSITFHTAEKFDWIETPTVTVETTDHGILETPLCTGSEFKPAPEGIEDTHEMSDWELHSDSGMIWESKSDKSNLTTIRIPEEKLAISTQYTIKVRYKGTSIGWSEWGSKQFTTAADFGTVNSPTVTVTGGPSSVRETPTLTGTQFSSTIPDTHKSTDWVVVKKSGSEEVWSSKGNTSNKTSISIPKGTLKVSTDYIAKVRYEGTKFGWGEWGQVEFRTVNVFKYVATPTITISEGNSDVTKASSIKSSEFKVME